MAISSKTKVRINRQAKIVAEDMVDEDNFVNLIRMNGALAIVKMALGMETDQSDNLLVSKDRKLRTKKT